MARSIGRPARAIGWTILAAVFALGGAGLVAQLSHPPGDDRRAELTWAADVALEAQLDDVVARLQDVGALVDGLAADAREALAAVSSGDTATLQTALERGAGRAATIDAGVAQLRASLAGLPGAGATATTQYSNATLVRRAAVVAAVDAVEPLSDRWAEVTARSSDAAALIEAIRRHDTTIASAAAAGVKAQWATAVRRCRDALDVLDEITAMRNQFIRSDEVTVLDDWIAIQGRHDEALRVLYRTLRRSDGKRNPAVDAAYREEQAALAQLPPDNRAIIVIISEVAKGGLNQAVSAIEVARGQIDLAISEVAPSEAP